MTKTHLYCRILSNDSIWIIHSHSVWLMMHIFAFKSSFHGDVQTMVFHNRWSFEIIGINHLFALFFASVGNAEFLIGRLYYLVVVIVAGILAPNITGQFSRLGRRQHETKPNFYRKCDHCKADFRFQIHISDADFRFSLQMQN